MEDRQFDELTKKLAKPVSRRTVFKAAIATAVGGIGAMATFGRARAAPGPNCKGAGLGVCTLRGQFTAECCTNYCTSAGVCGCPTGQSVCNNGSGEKCYGACTGGRIRNTQTCVCECPPGQNECAGKCVNFLTDTSNCGSCGHVCPSGTVCSNGVCATTCGAGLTNCSGSCVDLTSNPFNCGSCGTVCPANSSCVGGTCTCLSGFVACTPPGGTLTCHTACPNGQVVNSLCTGCTCPAGTLPCPFGGLITPTTVCCTSAQSCCGTGAGQNPVCCNNASTVCCNGGCQALSSTSATCLAPPAPGTPVCCPAAPPAGPAACIPISAGTTCTTAGGCCPLSRVCCNGICCCQPGKLCINAVCANFCSAAAPCPAGCSCFTTVGGPCGGATGPGTGTTCFSNNATTGLCAGSPQACGTVCQCPSGFACVPRATYCGSGAGAICVPFCSGTTCTPP